MRVLIAGVGYLHLRDLSLGPALVNRLRALSWPPHVDIADLSYGPIAVVQWFEDSPNRYARAIFVSAVQRGRAPGDVCAYRWNGALPDVDEIQTRIGEAVTGVISLDNLLIIAGHFGVLPPDVHVIEVEPEDTNWGLGFTTTVEAAISTVTQMIRKLALDGQYAGSG